MVNKKNTQGFETKAIHAGQEPDPVTGAIMTPISVSSTYIQESPGVHKDSPGTYKLRFYKQKLPSTTLCIYCCSTY